MSEMPPQASQIGTEHPPVLDPDQPGVVRPGQTLNDRYRLVRVLASGGMASVWEGHDQTLARDVAIKIPHAHLASDPTFSQRFRREAVAAARLSHPNIVATFDTGIDRGTPFMVMELIRGRTLKQILVGHGVQSEPVAVGVAVQIADALDAAHRAGLIHRDVKPANILLIEDHRHPDGTVPTVKVADFGVARLNGLAEDGNDLTSTGTVVGTASYLAPEQVQGGSLDARTDVYALGVLLYEQLCGQPPFRRNTDLGTALAHVQDAPAPVRHFRPDVSSALESIVLACLAKSPEHRPPSAADLAAALRWLDVAPTTSDPDRDGRPTTATTTLEPPAAADPRMTAQLHSPRRTADGRTAVQARPPASNRTSVLPPGNPTGPPRPVVRGERSPAAPAFPVRSRVPLIVVVGVVVAALITSLAVLALVGDGTEDPAVLPEPPAGSGAEESRGAVRPAAARTIDPQGDGDENGNDARLAIDGNRSTTWATDQYKGPEFGRLKDGVGLYVQLNRAATIKQVAVDTPTQSWQASVYTATRPADTLTGWGPARGSKSGVNGGTTFTVDDDPTGQYVLLWITDPGSSNKMEISEIRVS